jgi:A/G-specific adenine glycosylase
MLPAHFSFRLVEWYRAHRRDLPWRRTRDAYAIWVSEVMLQQTRVAVVVPYWERWMGRFPTAAALAEAPLDDVLASWSGLGYYGRARNLHAGAREVMARYGGVVPGDAAELRRLPGIGRYTSGAIASMAFGRREPVVDGNVARVLARVFAIEEDVKSTPAQKRLWQLAAELVPDDAPGDFNQALMELGATVCTPNGARPTRSGRSSRPMASSDRPGPRCEACPVVGACAARAAGRERELPVVALRAADRDKPVLRTVAAWMERRGRVLLARRRPEGLFGGLWELPQAASRPALARLLLEMGAPARIAAGPPVARHQQVLSHRRLAIVVVAATPAGRATAPRGAGGYDRAAWHARASLGTLGLAASSRAILRLLPSRNQGETSACHDP